MPTSAEGASRGAPHHVEPAQGSVGPAALLEIVQSSLEDSKAEEVVTIDLSGKTVIGDYMVVASGRSERHVGAIADNLVKHLKEMDVRDVSVLRMVAATACYPRIATVGAWGWTVRSTGGSRSTT